MSLSTDCTSEEQSLLMQGPRLGAIVVSAASQGFKEGGGFLGRGAVVVNDAEKTALAPEPFEKRPMQDAALSLAAARAGLSGHSE